MDIVKHRIRFSDSIRADHYLDSIHIMSQTHVYMKGMPVQLNVYREGADVWFEGTADALKIAMMHAAQYMHNNGIAMTSDDSVNNRREQLVREHVPSAKDVKVKPQDNILVRIGKYIASLFKPFHLILATVIGVGCAIPMSTVTTYFAGFVAVVTATPLYVKALWALAFIGLALVAQGIALALLRLVYTGSIFNTESNLIRTPAAAGVFTFVASFIFDLRGLVVMTWMPAMTVISNALIVASIAGLAVAGACWLIERCFGYEYGHALNRVLVD